MVNTQVKLFWVILYSMLLSCARYYRNTIAMPRLLKVDETKTTKAPRQLAFGTKESPAGS